MAKAVLSGQMFDKLGLAAVSKELLQIRDGEAYPCEGWGIKEVGILQAYCLFCETQKCGLISHLIELRYGVRCISPQIIQRKWVKGVCEEQRHDWLPGYIFLYTDEPLKEKFWMPGIIRWLGNGELQNQDLEFALMLQRRNGVMGTIRLVEVGERCVVNDPLWENMEGQVIKIDRGRKRCCVEFTFDSIRRSVWLGYELVQPVKQETDQ